VAPQRLAADLRQRGFGAGQFVDIGDEDSAFLAGDAGDLGLDHPVDDRRQMGLQPLRQHRPQHLADQAFERGLARTDDLRLRPRFGEHRQRGERFAHRPRGALGGQARRIHPPLVEHGRFVEIEDAFVPGIFAGLDERFGIRATINAGGFAMAPLDLRGLAVVAGD
jgi:hypothetical protein